MGRPPKNEAHADNEALLIQYGFGDLPVTFAMQTQDGMAQEKEPCYLCQADGFYGRGTSGTHYMEGSIIVTDIVPNEHLQPLNRAAALSYIRWVKSLPNNRVQIDIGDMAEAAQMLAKNPEVTSLDPMAYQRALITLCEELKLRREGKDAKSLPSMGHNFAPQSGGNAPPILGAKVAAMNQRGPGFTASAPVIPANHQGGARRISPLGGPAPQ